MNKNKLFYCMFMVLFMVVSLFISCSNTITNDKGQVEIIQNPIIEEVEEVEGVRVISVTKAAYIFYKMEPLWNTPKGQAPYGSTIGLGIPSKPDGSEFDSKYKDFKLISSSSSSLGYFSQGRWKLTVDILDESYNSLLSSMISKEVYLNTISSTINIDLDNDMFSSGADNFSLQIKDIRVNLVENKNMYNVEEKNGFRFMLSVRKLATGSTNISNDITSVVIPKENIKFVDASGSETGIAVEGIIDYKLADSLPKGSYAVTICLEEYTDKGYENAGGVTFSFIGVGGTEAMISGSGTTIDLKAADFVPIKGDGGIIIDSGVKTEVTVNAYDSSNNEITTTTTGQSISIKAVVEKIIDENTSNTIKVNNYKWFVDGAEVTDKVNSSEGIALTKPVINLSDGSLLFYSSSAKTYTITYMFLDGTNYNAISGNCYLTVNAAATT